MEINTLSFDDSINADTEEGISEPSPVNKNGPCFVTNFAGDLDDIDYVVPDLTLQGLYIVYCQLASEE